MLHTVFGAFFLSIILSSYVFSRPLGCNSLIYCKGELLEMVQRSGIFQDSKTFVDMPTKRPVSEVLASFHQLPKNISLSELHQFINDNFDAPGSELDYPNPTDWKESIELFSHIKDKELLEFSKEIHSRWKNLIRFVNFTRLCEGCVSSHLNLKFPFVVPGGRFREFYYWDTYWILEGLLISEMWDTAKGVLLNFFDIIDQFGYIPNGSRIYYLNRSQPPLLIQMVKLYIEYTNDYSILLSAIGFLDREYLFWMYYRSIELEDPLDPLEKYRLNIYKANNSLPRPESYLEDSHIAKNFPSEEDRQKFYENVATAAESGWDFSSRWFKFNSTKLKEAHKGSSPFTSKTIPYEDLSSIDITSIIPLDLNALMFANEKALANFHAIMIKRYNLPYSPMESYYANMASLRYKAMKRFLWSTSLSMWSDYNYITKQLRNEALVNVASREDSFSLVSKFYISDFSPIWYFEDTELDGFKPLQIMYNGQDYNEDIRNLTDVVLLHLLEHIELSIHPETKRPEGPCLWGYPGGIPISEIISGQQWDFPNAWAPFQYYLVSALLKKSDRTSDAFMKKRLRDAALEVAQRWIKSTFCGWKRTGHFFEKYNVIYAGMAGGGGEYVVQDGFGWTNAVILMMLRTFGNELKVPDDCVISEHQVALFQEKFGCSPAFTNQISPATSRVCLKNLQTILRKDRLAPNFGKIIRTTSK